MKPEFLLISFSVLRKLVTIFPLIPDSEEGKAVIRVALWVLGDYCDNETMIALAVDVIKSSVGPLPLAAPMGKGDAPEPEKPTPVVSSGPKVLKDGSYATQSAADPAVVKKAAVDDTTPNLRRMVLGGEYYVASAIGATLTKLSLRLSSIVGPAQDKSKSLALDALIIISGIINFGNSPAVRLAFSLTLYLFSHNPSL